MRRKEMPSYERSQKAFEEIYIKLAEDAGFRDYVELEKYPVKEDLYISTIRVRPQGEKENQLMLTAGLHGMEGFWGGMLLSEYAMKLLSEINVENTGLLLVHGINPWGMANLRRTNENNVDLNRSFLLEEIAENYNSDYLKNYWFFKPGRLSPYKIVNDISFYLRLIRMLAMNGAEALGTMTLLGQYSFENGIYFGGREKQTSTEYVKKLMASVINADYKRIVHIDLHTGFGPRDQMSIVNSKHERKAPAEFSNFLDYPLVSAVSGDDFYGIQGDMTDYFYSIYKESGSDKVFYSTCFEFGTIGSSLLNKIASLRIMLQENSLHYMKSAPKALAAAIKEEFVELYYPGDAEWRNKAREDFEKAMRGIIRYFEL